MNISTDKIIEMLLERLSKTGLPVHLNRPWCDYQSDTPPELSLFVLEEVPLEHSGRCFKQELNFQIESFISYGDTFDIYTLISDVKRLLLFPKLPFPFFYLGYEIELPEEGSSVIRLKIKFKAHYFENF